MLRYVLIENGPYKGQEARIVSEEGYVLKLVVFGREMDFDRSQVRFLPDGYKPFEGMKMEAKTVEMTAGRITADTIKMNDLTANDVVNNIAAAAKKISSAGSLVGNVFPNKMEQIGLENFRPFGPGPGIETGMFTGHLSKPGLKGIYSSDEIHQSARTPIDSGALEKTTGLEKSGVYYSDKNKVSEPITKEKIDRYLEEWPSLDLDVKEIDPVFLP